MPRKFKIGFAIPPSNDIDVYSQDLGLIAIVENGELKGFNVAIGGGMGRTDSAPETYPRLADVIGYVEVDQSDRDHRCGNDGAARPWRSARPHACAL